MRVLPNSRYLLGAILMGVLACPAPASASSILFTTLGPGGEFDAVNGYFVDGSNFVNQVIANPFALGAAATVDDAVLALGNFDGANNPIDVYIESDSSGQPGSILATLSQVGTIPSFNGGSGSGLVTFTCSGVGCSLGAGSYWLVAREPDAGTQQVWDFAFGDPFTNGAFNQIGSATGPWFTTEQQSNGFRIDGAETGGSPVPEPASLTLLGLGLAGMAGRRGRQRKA